jgi:hypothetical protein
VSGDDDDDDDVVVVTVVAVDGINNKAGSVPINVTLRRVRVTIVAVEKQ